MLRTLTALAFATSVPLLTSPAHADEIRDDQWALRKLHAAEVWQLSQGEGITVAVVDSGVQADHPDLAGQVLPGTSSILSRTDDCRRDANGHGTGMAALIAGRNDDSDGIAGLAPKAKILPICALGSADPVSITKAIRYAVDHGAKVINISLGNPEPRTRDFVETAYEEAVRYAYAKNAVIVASAGNNGHTTNAPEYPGAFPGIVTAAAVDENGQAAPFSQHGPQVVLAAPGVRIRQPDYQGEKRIREGTSDAAAYTSATAALVFAKYPHLTAGQVINRLIKTTTRSQAGQPRNEYTGFGIINPKAALDPAFQDAPQTGNPLNPPGTKWPSGYTEPTPTPAEKPTPWWTWPLVVLEVAAIAAVTVTATVFLRRGRRRRTGT